MKPAGASSSTFRARRVLVVSRDARARTLCDDVEAAGLSARVLREEEDAARVAAQWQPDVVLVDAALDATSVVHAARAAHGAVLCVLLVPALSGDVMARLLESGADSLLPWPVDITALRRLLAVGGAVDASLASERMGAVSGSSAEIARVWRDVLTASQSRAPLLITGETGVGKEVVARAVHRLSPRRGPFVAVNCAALPETLLEAELFGHERGAFTGAAQMKKGRFELADQGTLFLDEIGDLPLSMQVKLLRVLQERTFERLGGSESLSVDVRIVAATHRDLEAECRAGRFRLDLFYRLNVLALHIPPLREREGDVLELWDHFIGSFCLEEGRPVPVTSQAARARLARYGWPGNVRELQNTAQHALTVAQREVIEETDLPPRVRDGAPRAPALSLVGMTLQEIERLAIEQTYAALGTVHATAAALGVSERTLYTRLRLYRSAAAPTRESPVAGADAARVVVAEGSEERARTGPHERGAAKLRVLLAEDDDDLRVALSDFLRGEGYDVVAVADGRAALVQLGRAAGDAAAAVDVIVTDVRMPRANGLEVLAGARALGLSLPVIVLSAFGDRGTRERALELGAAMFLDKPIAIPELQRAITSLSQ